MKPLVDLHCHLKASRADSFECFQRLAADPRIHRVAVCALDLGLTPSERYPTVPACESTNAQVAELIEAVDSPKLVPWLFVDPREPDAAQQVERWARECGMRGVKMYPPAGWYPDEPRVLPAFQAAEELGLPVLLHMGRVAAHPELRAKYGNPVCLEEVGLACPELKILIGHFANMWREEAYHISQSFPNFFFDLTSSGSADLDILRRVVENPALGLRRLVLGTDGDGATNIERATQKLERLRDAGFSEDELDAIMHDNGLAVLGERG